MVELNNVDGFTYLHSAMPMKIGVAEMVTIIDFSLEGNVPYCEEVVVMSQTHKVVICFVEVQLQDYFNVGLVVQKDYFRDYDMHINEGKVTVIIIYYNRMD